MSLESLQRWYARRDPREQRVLKLGALIVPVLVLLVGLLALQRAGSTLEHRVATKQKDLAWIRAVLPTVAAAGPGRSAEAGETLVGLVDRTIKESGLSTVVTGALPEGDKVLTVSFEKAPFSGLLAWAKRLAEQHGLRITAASIDDADEAGSVNASFTLSDGG